MRLKPEAEIGTIAIGDASLNYQVQRSARRRSLCLMFEAGHGFRVLVPRRASPRAIHDFLSRHSAWLAKRMSDDMRQRDVLAREYSPDATLPFMGRDIPLTDAVADTSLAAPDMRLEVMRWYKQQARSLLRTRIDELAAQMGLTYRSFRLSNPRRQWGSCSAANDIRINWRIIMAPPEIIDYLLVHELAHIKQKNHSPRFWNVVASMLPDHAELRARLRRNEAEWLARLR